MPDGVRIRLEGCLEQVESWRHQLRLGLDEARSRGRFGALVEALERAPVAAEQAVRRMLPQAPELGRLLRELERLRARASALVADRARVLCLPQDLLGGARALAAEPIELELGLVDPDEAAKGTAMLSIGVFFSSLAVLGLGAAGLFLLLLALPVAAYQMVHSGIRVIVTPRRVLVGKRVLEREGLNRYTLDALLAKLRPREGVLEMYDRLWPPAPFNPPGP